MLRAIQLGKNALGTAAPNPMVGCVIVHKKTIIGEGFTSPHGGPHAEVNAINSVADKSLLKEATLYVTLEPCSHYGKTPPCADLIVKHQVKKVVIGLKDPNIKVAGKGIDRLKNAGIDVVVGVHHEKCREHHNRFLTFQEKKRPYIILKWAETADGFIAPNPEKRNRTPEPFWITNLKSRQLTHKWRSEEMAILVGTNTVLEDNPKLDVRHWSGTNPTRVVLDRNTKVPENFHVLNSSTKTIVLTETLPKQNKENIEYLKIDFKGNIAEQICELLYNSEINSVIVEGGNKTLQTFINDNLWDEARIFTGHSNFGSGIPSPKIKGRINSKTKILDDSLTILINDTKYYS